MTHPNEANTEETVELIFSRDRKLYYVAGLDHHRPKDWVAVDPDDDGKYKVYSFAFYEVKSGDHERRPIADPLVVRYMESQGWPTRGTPEWVDGIEHARDSAMRQRDEAARKVKFYEDEMDRLTALLAASPEAREDR